jgi:hypothetical protein
LSGVALNIEHERFHNVESQGHLMSTKPAVRSSSARVVPNG